jgi:hypothetical protein
MQRCQCKGVNAKVDKSGNCDKITLAHRSEHAEVAELADALRSGRSGHTLVWVQIPPSALDPDYSGSCYLTAHVLAKSLVPDV